MGNLVLHVGMPKTGTSFLQGILNRNKSLIERIGDIKLVCGPTPHVIASFLIEDNSLTSRTDIDTLRKLYNENIYSELDHYSKLAKNVILSSEYFILCNKERILSYFGKHFSDIEIIITVRRQDKLLASGYNQDVKALNRKTNLSWNPFDAPYLDYWEFCEEWSKLGIKIHVIDYDLVRTQKDGLLTSFFSKVSIDLTSFKNAIVTPGDDASNYSLSYNEVLLKLALNRMGISNKTDIFSEFIKNNKFKSPFELPKNLENCVMSYYENNNKKLVDKYLSADSSFLFHDISKDKRTSFDWDPLENIENLITFLTSKCS